MDIEQVWTCIRNTVSVVVGDSLAVVGLWILEAFTGVKIIGVCRSASFLPEGWTGGMGPLLL